MNAISDRDIPIILNALNRGAGAFAKMNWREIAAMKRFDGIHFATLNGYANGRPIVNKKHRLIFGLPALVEVTPCHICGDAPTVCLCDGSRVVKPRPASKRTTPPRFTVYSGTDTDKILLELEKLTGRRWACLDVPQEMEF